MKYTFPDHVLQRLLELENKETACSFVSFEGRGRVFNFGLAWDTIILGAVLSFFTL